MSRIHAITPFTMLDYPGEMACIVWFAKCNLRCVYCHNPEIVFGEGSVQDETFEAFLKKRQGQLTAIVLSGGEPTFCPDLATYAAQAKALGYKVKLDTNGSNPEVVRSLVRGALIDRIALDYKAPEDRLAAIVGTDRFAAPHRETLLFAIEAAKAGLISFEVRTTYHSGVMDEGDLNRMIDTLEAAGYAGIYYIQNIVSTGEETIGHIEEPTRRLDTALLKEPAGFKLGFRNFKYIRE